MLALLSPAKTLDLSSPLPATRPTRARLLGEAARLADVVRGLPAAELADLMGLSEDLAALTAERFAAWEPEHPPAAARPAALTFAGDVYRGLAAAQRFGARDWTEAGKTLRILSGLYGLLRPLDLIRPHRLEMGTRLTTDRGADLYAWWGSAVTDLVAEDLAASPGPDVVVDLASQEYSRVVDRDRLGARVVAPRFLDVPAAGGEPRVVSFFAKQARGEYAAWLVLERVRSVRALRGFAAAGYRYDADRSTPDVPTFVRGRTGA